MKKKKLWLDIRHSIAKSMGRFISIFSLMLLGTFVFVGLQVTGPNMRNTAEEFFDRHNLSDITVISDWGLDKKDKEILKNTDNLNEIEFGYIRDVLVKGTDKSFRIFSNSEKISKYELIEGQFPKDRNDIVLDYLQDEKYNIGDYIEFKEGSDKNILKEEKFKIVGFVKSSEIVQKNSIGYTNIGTGELDSFGVVNEKVFDSEVFMIARMTFKDTKDLGIYSGKYEDIIRARKKQLKGTLNKRSKLRLEKFQKEKQNEIDSGFESIKEGKKKLELGLNSSNKDIQKEIKGQIKNLELEKEELRKSEIKIKKLIAPKYTVKDRSDNPGYQQHLENSERIDILSRVFPVFLFAIAVLVSLTTMTRFVEEERINMGTLKALGYSNFDIKKKFIVYGLVSGLSGTLIGIILGHTILPLLIFEAYAATTTFTELKLAFYPLVTIVSIIIVIIFTVVSAYIVATKELRDSVSQLLMPKAPKEGSRIFLERIGFIWNRLSFTYKVTARNLFRYKKRMLMTILGVAGCTGLLVMGFGIKHSLEGIVSRQFGEIIKYDLLVTKNENTKELKDLLSEDIIKRKKDIFYDTIAVNSGELESSMIVTKDSNELKKYINLVNRKTKEELNLENEGVVITEKIATLLNLKVGDKIKLDDNGKDREIKVSGITEMYMGHYIFMNSENYKSVFSKEIKNNSYLITLKDNSKSNIRSVSSQFVKTDGVQGVIKSNSISKKIDDTIAGLDKVILVLISCASLLAIVVIYNLTNINVSERVRELSTIKVLGFYDEEVTMYIYRETIFLSILGVFSGYVLGRFLHGFIITTLPPNEVMFDPILRTSNFIMSGMITMGITFLLMLVMHRRIRKINMLEALKSVE